MRDKVKSAHCSYCQPSIAVALATLYTTTCLDHVVVKIFLYYRTAR